jgi:hypothetical protein
MPMNPRLSEQQTEDDVPWLLVALIVFHVSFGLIMIGFFAHKAWPVAMLWAGTCALIGSTVGFLFGIPRTLQGNQELQQNTLINSRSIEDTDGHQEASSEVHAEKLLPSALPATDADYQLRVNTNLEQISDWLTKILVGVGLTQLNSLPGKLMRAATFVANGVNSDKPPVVFALALIIYFHVLGFLSGYLCTRLFLQPAFRRWDRGDVRLP